MFGVIRVNDEESNELLFLVGYEPIRGHGLSVIRWILWNSTHTTTKLNFSLPRRRQQKKKEGGGWKKAQTNNKKCPFFPPKTSHYNSIDEPLISLSLTFHPLISYAPHGNQRKILPYVWAIFEKKNWLNDETRPNPGLDWYSNLSSSVSLWSDDQRKVRPIQPSNDSSFYIYCAVSRMKVGWTWRHLLMCTVVKNKRPYFIVFYG